MSVPPSDPGQLNSGGFQPLLSPQPANPYAQQYAYLPNPYAQTPYPVTPPKQSHTTRTALIVCSIVVVVVALIAIFIGTTSTSPNPTPASPSMPAASPIPGTGVPIDVAPDTVVEAIDLGSQPSLGAAWNASDGNPGRLDPQFFVTPCGVLVTVLTSDYDNSGQGASARLVGYEISTGIKAWTVPLQVATGLNDPSLRYDVPTYTPDCSMVLTFRDMDSTILTMVALMVDLATGEATPFASSEDLRRCAATGPGRAACWGFDVVTVFDIAQGTHQSMSTSNPGSVYVMEGDIVIDGMVWGGDGYLDPATSDVVFGTDVYVPNLAKDKDADWVVYVEPLRPGGYRSGLAVRVEGPLGSDEGTCRITVWDAQSDTGSWAHPASLPCGSNSSFDWTVTESALVISEIGKTARAFSLTDGTLLWEKEAGLSSTAWSRANEADVVRGLTGDFAVFYNRSWDEDIVRIADGETVPNPSALSWDFMTLSPTMAYASGYVSSGRNLAGFSLDGSGTPLWTVDLPSDSFNFWTFATGGTMYVVSSGYAGSISVIPLVT